MKFLNGIASMFLNETHNDPYVRIAEVEYSKEYRHFVKSFGRRPTREEAKHIMYG